MLVLTRRKDESIDIGAGVRITVLGFEEGRVKLGIEAPDKVAIVRSELVERKAAAR